MTRLTIADAKITYEIGADDRQMGPPRHAELPEAPITQRAAARRDDANSSPGLHIATTDDVKCNLR